LKTGAVFVAAVSVLLFGVYDYLKYKKCINALEEAVKLFNLFKNEIYYQGSDYNALCRLGENQGFRVLAFKDSAILLQGVEDKQIQKEFSYFVEKIGTTDIEGQLAVCTEAVDKLSTILNERTKKESSKLQVNMSLSILGALSMIIIFI
jgi:hypothetical protein